MEESAKGEEFRFVHKKEILAQAYILRGSDRRQEQGIKKTTEAAKSGEMCSTAQPGREMSALNRRGTTDATEVEGNRTGTTNTDNFAD